MKHYFELLDIYEKIRLLDSISGVLYWDMNVVMPSNIGAINYRSKQFQYLSQEIHRLITKNKTAELLEKCEKDKSLDNYQKRNIQLIRRMYENRTALTSELVGQMSKQSNKTLEIWKKAKVKKDFSLVKDDLEKLFKLNVQAAELYATKKEINDPFDALIDTRDKGFSVSLLSKLFDDSKSYLIPLLKKVKNKSEAIRDDFLNRKVAKEIQIRMVNELAKFLEYDAHSDKAVGNIAEVEHPLTIGCGYKDVRVTVKYLENNVLASFFACAHECGHALHGLQGRDEWYNQPIYRISSPSFGESQSRFIENIVIGSKDFWEYYFPKLNEQTNAFGDISLNTFYSAINKVKPSLIRIQADELTYMLHIIIRFEIERDWFAGKITTDELPLVWNQKYAEYLGVEVTDDGVGVMQDLHWYSQYYGYFFGYGIGDLIAAQLSNKLTKTNPDWKEFLREGHFSPVREWLEKNVHKKGGLFDCLDLVEEITGKMLSTKYHQEYLEEKYLRLYS
ncbi:MAG: carboxypeptidase M32 [Candidatus Heimdallarchaeum endolithica]|uniref:Metal-dependent carboxypeptidase n=1 Tax=Candidatus Heimdallarchaeum endolithica TaxID=2876572 RepID=A0A9Y1FMU7_9ARCH|nr:MAG: carboxypeptidase M32 [Candidatus Heimdallarchaeum endolithica]